jgi:uncharacterized membrane protein
MPSYASLNDVLSLCMIMAVLALLVGHSQFFASPHFVLSMSSTRATLNAYIDDQDCVSACYLKNYSFVITYLLEDKQELSLGMLDMSQTYL